MSAVKLLVVEDNPAMRRLITRVVRDLADSIVECADGAEAFDAYARHRPDWVLMDLEMGELDGLSATRRIVDAFPDASIIIVTNYDDAYLRAAAGEAGARGYLLKENLTDVPAMLRPPATPAGG